MEKMLKQNGRKAKFDMIKKSPEFMDYLEKATIIFRNNSMM